MKTKATTLETANTVAFYLGYRECAFWLLSDDEGLELSMDVDQMSQDLVIESIVDCVAFLYDDKVINAINKFSPNYGQAGHDFFLTRNGQGTGFWDRDYYPKALRALLTQRAKDAKPADWYVGDDGLLYV